MSGDDLTVSFNSDEGEDENVDFQIVNGVLGSWQIVKNVAYSNLQTKVDGIYSTVYDSETGISIVSQNADRIGWLIQSGTSSANMVMTSDALSAIANDF